MLRRQTAMLVLGPALAAGLVAAPAREAVTAAAGGVCAGVPGCRVVAHSDVNGDGARDAVGFARRGGGLGDAGSVTVRVCTAPGRVVSVRRPLENWSDSVWQGVATLDGRRGKDIMVGRQMGASAHFYQSLTWRRGTLVSLDAPGPDRWWPVGHSATAISGWLRRPQDDPGTISWRVAENTSTTSMLHIRGRVTTYRWTPQGWVKLRTRTVPELSQEQARTWGGFRVPGLARW